MKVFMIVFASAFVITGGGIATASWSASPNTDATFCRAIGLEEEQPG